MIAQFCCEVVGSALTYILRTALLFKNRQLEFATDDATCSRGSKGRRGYIVVIGIFVPVTHAYVLLSKSNVGVHVDVYMYDGDGIDL